MGELKTKSVKNNKVYICSDKNGDLNYSRYKDTKEGGLKHLRIDGEENLKKFLEITKINLEEINVNSWYEKKFDNGGLNETNFGVDWEILDDKWYEFEIKFEKEEDIIKFEKLLNFKFYQKSGWFPEYPQSIQKKGIWRHSSEEKDEDVINKYPIYIISRGRYKKLLTYKSISEMTPRPNFKIVIEEYEVDLYIQYGVDKEDILVFTQEEKDYVTEEGDGGSIPVRNFCKNHSFDNGYEFYWIIDDNVNGFYRFYKNTRLQVKSPVVFRSIENYLDRYKNLKMTGMNYFGFCPNVSKRRLCCQENSRVYSITLLSNTIYNWRGIYNEDTDLSLRLLKMGYPIRYFNHFLGNKMTTKSIKGGNTDTIYKDDGLQKKLESLIKQHPDVVKGGHRYKKDNHHYVDYTPFKDNKLIEKDNLEDVKRFKLELFDK